MRIKDVVALVTGANGGIGKHYVEALRAAGAARMYVGARDPEKVAEMVSMEPERIIPVSLDVTDEQSVAAATTQC